jgi:hypothetical protein
MTDENEIPDCTCSHSAAMHDDELGFCRATIRGTPRLPTPHGEPPPDGYPCPCKLYERADDDDDYPRRDV